MSVSNNYFCVCVCALHASTHLSYVNHTERNFLDPSLIIIYMYRDKVKKNQLHVFHVLCTGVHVGNLIPRHSIPCFQHMLDKLGRPGQFGHVVITYMYLPPLLSNHYIA